MPRIPKEDIKEPEIKVVEVPVEISIDLKLLNDKLNAIMKNQEAIFQAIENPRK